jgi:hypothetical protein
MFWGIILLTVLGLLTSRYAYLWGRCDGIEMGWEQGDREIIALQKHYEATIGSINVALGSLSAGEIVTAKHSPTTDKVTALLAAMDKNASKAFLDAKARAAEFRA